MNTSDASQTSRSHKIAVVGTPGTGKAALVQAMVERFGGEPVRVTEVSGATIASGSFYWPGDPGLQVSLHTFYGPPDFSSMRQMLLRGCDGLVFVADAHPDRIALAPGELRRMIGEAALAGVDLATTPVAMQYHRTECFPGFNPEEMDRFLKVSPNVVPRFATSSRDSEGATQAIQWVIQTVVAKLAPPAAAAAG